jgi:hypothetical protein
MIDWTAIFYATLIALPVMGAIILREIMKRGVKQ